MLVACHEPVSIAEVHNVRQNIISSLPSSTNFTCAGTRVAFAADAGLKLAAVGRRLSGRTLAAAAAAAVGDFPVLCPISNICPHEKIKLPAAATSPRSTALCFHLCVLRGLQFSLQLCQLLRLCLHLLCQLLNDSLCLCIIAASHQQHDY